MDLGSVGACGIVSFSSVLPLGETRTEQGIQTARAPQTDFRQWRSVTRGDSHTGAGNRRSYLRPAWTYATSFAARFHDAVLLAVIVPTIGRYKSATGISKNLADFRGGLANPFRLS